MTHGQSGARTSSTLHAADRNGAALQLSQAAQGSRRRAHRLRRRSPAGDGVRDHRGRPAGLRALHIDHPGDHWRAAQQQRAHDYRPDEHAVAADRVGRASHRLARCRSGSISATGVRADDAQGVDAARIRGSAHGKYGALRQPQRDRGARRRGGAADLFRTTPVILGHQQPRRERMGRRHRADPAHYASLE